MIGTDTEEIIHDGVDGGILIEGPSNSGSIIPAWGGNYSGRCLDNCGGNQLLKDQGL